MAELPTGTVTFLHTDIEDSTRLLQRPRARRPELPADARRRDRGSQGGAGHQVVKRSQ
jgi:hypothetical protein